MKRKIPRPAKAEAMPTPRTLDSLDRFSEQLRAQAANFTFLPAIPLMGVFREMADALRTIIRKATPELHPRYGEWTEVMRQADADKLDSVPPETRVPLFIKSLITTTGSLLAFAEDMEKGFLPTPDDVERAFTAAANNVDIAELCSIEELAPATQAWADKNTSTLAFRLDAFGAVAALNPLYKSWYDLSVPQPRATVQKPAGRR